jgi:hypothetical protein
VGEGGWRIILEGHKPMGSIGRNITNNKLLHLLSRAFTPFTHIPGLQECFLHRITFILEKPNVFISCPNQDLI